MTSNSVKEMRKENRTLVLEDLIWHEKRRLTDAFPNTFVRKVKLATLKCLKLNEEIVQSQLSTDQVQAIIREVKTHLNSNFSNPFVTVVNEYLLNVQKKDEKLKDLQTEIDTLNWFIQSRLN